MRQRPTTRYDLWLGCSSPSCGLRSSRATSASPAPPRAATSSSGVPLSEMFGYSTDLRSRTQGRATYTMQFHSYQQVPEAIASDIVKRVRGE